MSLWPQPQWRRLFKPHSNWFTFSDTTVYTIHIIFMLMSACGSVSVFTMQVNVNMLHALMLMLLTLLLFYKIRPQPQITCITPLSFVCFLWNVLCRCLRSFFLHFMSSGCCQCRCWLFSPLIWLLLGSGFERPEAPKLFGLCSCNPEKRPFGEHLI